MAGAEPRVRGLRAGDPRELGAYQIVGRLGEGGMGSVFLATSPDGRAVALKVIRAELADNAEFRRRFRSEVARARQVPPFCTAEVLDADTEHDPPYLVVEYVDGPSLSDVVEQRGPLSPANQHGIALGVAVALTAIHGAGVIHRDLKPSNVLLAPGSPKVIDFGIARTAAGSHADTGTDQVVGTVAYMAPERFGPDASRALTPAADVFAWGAVVAFAATGRTPFGGDLPAATAVQIMTQPPDLDGLSGPLRELVQRALAKDPARRPTARELVDGLLAGASPVAARPAAFAEQAEILAAAGIAPTTVRSAVSQSVAPVRPGWGADPSPVQPWSSGPDRPGSVGPGQVGPPPSVTPLGGATVYIPAPRRGGGAKAAIGALTAAVVLLAGAVVAIWTGKVGGLGAGPAASAPATKSSVSTSGVTVELSPDATAIPSIDPKATALVRGSLERWKPREDPIYDASCTVGGVLTVMLRSLNTGSYRCRGVDDTLANLSVVAAVTLANASSCAGIWFRYTDSAGGYALLVCADRYELVSHVGTKITTLTRPIEVHTPTPAGQPIRVGIRTEGQRIWFFRNDQTSEVTADQPFTMGRVVLGVFADATATPVTPPFEVSFANVEIWRASAI